MDLRESLQAAFGAAYVIERELGGGGMSRVFVATESALGRSVVLKVLPPELAAGLSVDRFRREIQVAASLQHPHIVPLLTAGQAGQFLYYSMPLIEGESLRVRLKREGELPIGMAARLLAEVARALAHAHRHGIVHRDIKPENILLAGDEAQVADFGIAKALTASAEGSTLTAVGMAIGTPAYMAPEQAVDAYVDHRADLYALGVVAYEMLAGQPPFGGRTAAQLLAAHATQTPVKLATLRPAVPPALAELVMRLLEKRPADRPQSADEVLRALEMPAASTEAHPAASTMLPTAPAVPTVSTRHRGRWMVVGGVAAAVFIASLAWLSSRGRPVNVDRDVVAVAPFRVSGADSSLAYLREGIVDLLAAKLAGSTNLRASDTRALLSAWRRVGGDADLAQPEALQVAALVGAGRLVRGEVVGTPRHITINATLLDAPGGKERARASVEGSADSLTRLVDQLAVALLALDAGEGERRLNSLTSRSLPAVRAYLAGQALLRVGRFEEAYERFDDALDLDSNFALAGLGHLRAGEWLGKGWWGRGAEVAWRRRDNLAVRDRVHLEYFLGPKFPARRTLREVVADAERFVAVAGDSPEAWYQFADNLYHFGPRAGITDALPRARQAFERALALDPRFAPALEHLPILDVELGDTSAAQRSLEALARLDSASPDVAALRLYLADVRGDTAAARLLSRNDSVVAGYGRVNSTLASQGFGALYAADLVQRRRRTAVTRAEREDNAEAAYAAFSLLGLPGRAAAVVDSLPQHMAAAPILAALFADGDSAAAARAAERLERTLDTPVTLTWPGGGTARYALAQYSLEHGRVDLAKRIAAQLRTATVPADSAWFAEAPGTYAAILDAQIMAREAPAEAAAALERLDSVLANPGFGYSGSPGNLIAARLHEQRGESEQALQALRRRVFDLFWSPEYTRYYREEGRLAALTGDRAGAVAAYNRYLRIRFEPEPRLRAQRDSVLAELAALERESTDR
jgi:tRNA A-37 threonylcarbamoyl transferase component Bud32/tetratricopeptide (TPR) repeat protein